MYVLCTWNLSSDECRCTSPLLAAVTTSSSIWSIADVAASFKAFLITVTSAGSLSTLQSPRSPSELAGLDSDELMRALVLAAPTIRFPTPAMLTKNPSNLAVASFRSKDEQHCIRRRTSSWWCIVICDERRMVHTSGGCCPHLSISSCKTLYRGVDYIHVQVADVRSLRTDHHTEYRLHTAPGSMPDQTKHTTTRESGPVGHENIPRAPSSDTILNGTSKIRVSR